MSTLSGSFAKGEKGKSGKYVGININSLYKGKPYESQEKKTLQKHGLQSLGKVSQVRRMPPPANLPSLKSENSGNDPNVNLVPTGASGWGNKETAQGSPPPPSTTKGGDSGSSTGAPTAPIPPTPSPAVDAVPKSNESSGPPPNKIPATSSCSSAALGGERSWSSITSKVSERAPGFLKHESASFQQEFPELAGEADQKQQQSDLSYGPVPSLRPQTEGSWIQGGGRNVPPSQPSAQPQPPPPQAKIMSGSPSPSDIGAGGMAPPAGVPVQEGPPHMPALGPGSGHMSMPRMHGPAGHPPQPPFRIMPPFMMNYQSPYPPPNYSPRVPPPAPPRNPYPFDGGFRPNMRQQYPEEDGYAPRPIVKKEDLESFDDLTNDRDNWAANQSEIDYNKKLNFSDDEEDKEDDSKKHKHRNKDRPPKDDPSMGQRWHVPHQWAPPTSYRGMPPHGYPPQHCEEEGMVYRRKNKIDEVAQVMERGRKIKEEDQKRFNESKGGNEGHFAKDDAEVKKEREDMEKDMKVPYPQEGHRNLPPRLQKHHMQQQAFMRPPYEPWPNPMAFMGAGMPVNVGGMHQQRRPRTGSEDSDHYDRPPSAGSSSDRYWPARDPSFSDWNRRHYNKQEDARNIRSSVSAEKEPEREEPVPAETESEEHPAQVQKDPFEDNASPQNRSQTNQEREQTHTQPRPPSKEKAKPPKRYVRPEEKPPAAADDKSVVTESSAASPVEEVDSTPNAWKSEPFTHSWAEADDESPSERTREFNPVPLMDSKPKPRTDPLPQRSRISAPAPITRERLEAAEQQEKKSSNLTPLKSLGKKEPAHPPMRRNVNPPQSTPTEPERPAPPPLMQETSWDQEKIQHPEPMKKEETKNAWRIPTEPSKSDLRSQLQQQQPEPKADDPKKMMGLEEGPKEHNEKPPRKDYRSRGGGRGGQRGNNSYQVYRGGRPRGSSLGKGDYRKRPSRGHSEDSMWPLDKWGQWDEFSMPSNEEKKQREGDRRRGGPGPYDRNTFRGEARGRGSWRGSRSRGGSSRRGGEGGGGGYRGKPRGMDGASGVGGFHSNVDRPRNRGGEPKHNFEHEHDLRAMDHMKEFDHEGVGFGGGRGGSGRSQKTRKADRQMPPRFQRKHENESDGRGPRQPRKGKAKSPEGSGNVGHFQKQNSAEDQEDWETESENSETVDRARSDGKSNKKSFSGQRPGGDRNNRRNPGSGGGPPRGAQQPGPGKFGNQERKGGGGARNNNNNNNNNKAGPKSQPSKSEDTPDDASKGKADKPNGLKGYDLTDIAGVVIIDNITDGLTESEATSTEEGFQPVLSKRQAKEKQKLNQSDDTALPRTSDTPTPPLMVPHQQPKENRGARSKKEDKKSKNNKASYTRAPRLPPRFAKQKENSKGSSRPPPELAKHQAPPPGSVGVFSAKEGSVPAPPGNAWEKPIASMLRSEETQGMGHHGTGELADKSQLDGSNPPVTTIIFENTNLKSPGADPAAFQTDMKPKYTAQPKPQRQEKPRERKEKLEIEQPKIENTYPKEEPASTATAGGGSSSGNTAGTGTTGGSGGTGAPPPPAAAAPASGTSTGADQTSSQRSSPPIQLPFSFKSEDNNLAFTLPPALTDEKGSGTGKGTATFSRSISSQSPISPSTAELELKIGSCKKMWDMPTVMEHTPTSESQQTDTNSPLQDTDECNTNFSNGSGMQGPVKVTTSTTAECPPALTGPPSSSSNVCKVKPQQVVSQIAASPPPIIGIPSHTTSAPQHGPVGYQVSNTFSEGYRSNALEMMRGDHGNLAPAGLSVNSNQPGGPGATVGFQPLISNTAPTAPPAQFGLSAVPSPPMMYNSSQQVVTQAQIYTQYPQFEGGPPPQMLTANVGPAGVPTGRASQFNTPQYAQAGYVGLSQQTPTAFSQNMFLQTAPQPATPAAPPPPPPTAMTTDLYRMHAFPPQPQPHTSQNTMLLSSPATSSCKSSIQQNVKVPHTNSQQMIFPYDLISLPNRYIQTQTPPTGPPPYNQQSAQINLQSMQLQAMNMGQNAYSRPPHLLGKQGPADTLRTSNQIPSPGPLPPNEPISTYLQGYNPPPTSVAGMDKLGHRKPGGSGGFNRSSHQQMMGMGPGRTAGMGGRQMMMVTRPPGPSPLQHVNAHSYQHSTNAPRFQSNVPPPSSYFTAAQPGKTLGGRDRGTPTEPEEGKSDSKGEELPQDSNEDPVMAQ